MWPIVRLNGNSPKARKVYPVKEIVSAAQKRMLNHRYMFNFRNSRLTLKFAVPFTLEKALEAVSEIECGKTPG